MLNTAIVFTPYNLLRKLLLKSNYAKADLAVHYLLVFYLRSMDTK
jgi:hypothetical protein